MQEINTLIIPQTILNFSNNNINNRSYLCPKRFPAFLRKNILQRLTQKFFDALCVPISQKSSQKSRCFGEQDKYKRKITDVEACQKLIKRVNNSPQCSIFFCACFWWADLLFLLDFSVIMIQSLFIVFTKIAEKHLEHSLF